MNDRRTMLFESKNFIYELSGAFDLLAVHPKRGRTRFSLWGTLICISGRLSSRKPSGGIADRLFFRTTNGAVFFSEPLKNVDKMIEEYYERKREQIE